MKKRFGKKGSVLVENVIFIILNIAYLSILIFFLSKQGSGVIVLEQSYAKNIALLIDSAKPVMEMKLNMEDAINLAQKNGVNKEDIVRVDENIVTVKLTPKGGYGYSFFNEVDISCYPDGKDYIFIINKKGSGNFCPAAGREGSFGGGGASGTY